jgi:site-specific DNA-methyltransferase (adenine-specific)
MTHIYTNTRTTPSRILIGDALEKLRELPDGSVDCIVTSPPYFQLRDYNTTGQYGLEASVEAWAENLAEVGRELHRVLAPHGTCWINVGDTYSRGLHEGAPRKSMLLAPQRLILKLLGVGWRVRNEIIWHKSNPVPSNVTDRLSTVKESIFLLTRQASYWFDLDAIRIPARSAAHLGRTAIQKPAERYLPERFKNLPGGGLAQMKARGVTAHPLGKSPGDVWTLPTSSFRGNHFATFPSVLVERMILAGCPERVCLGCGTPWRKQRANHEPSGRMLRIGQLAKDCTCETTYWRRGLVLDPFMGSGTTAVAAEKLHRDWVGIELNPAYAALAMERIEDARHDSVTNRRGGTR